MPTLLQTYNVFANIDAAQGGRHQGADDGDPWTWDAVPRGGEEADRQRQVRRRLGPEVPDRGVDEHGAELRRHVLLLDKATGKWIVKVGDGRDGRYLTHDARHDLDDDKSIDPAARRPERRRRAARLLRGQVRDDVQGNYAAQQMIQQAPEGLPLGDAAAAEGHVDRIRPADPQTLLGHAAEQAQARRRCSSSPTSCNAQNMAELAEGDWLIPRRSTAPASVIQKQTGGKNGWSQIAGRRGRRCRGAVQVRRELPAVEGPDRDTGSAAVLRRTRSTLDDLSTELADGWTTVNGTDTGRTRTAGHPPGGGGTQTATRRRVQRERARRPRGRRLAGAAVGDALGGATEGWTPRADRRALRRPVDGIVAAVRRGLAATRGRSRRTTRATATSPTTR